MPITNERVAKLREYGFSELAARTYLALLDLGTTEVRDIVKVSNVPSSKIYHILDQLQERGLATMLPEFPRRYAPVPFEEYLDRVHRELLDSARTIERERAELSALFPIVGTLEVGDRGGFTVLRGRRNVLDKLAELIRGTTEDWIVVGTPMSPHRQLRFIDDLRAAKERGVRLRLVAPVRDDNLAPLATLASAFEVHSRALPEGSAGSKVAFYIADGSRALIVTYDPDDMSLYTGKDVGMFTDHEAIVKAIVAIVESHWALTPPFTGSLPDETASRPAPFTRIYTSSDERLAWLDDALRQGCAAIRHANTTPARHLSLDFERLTARAEARGVRTRVLLNLADPKDVARADALLRACPSLDLRHLASPAYNRFTLLDDREALVSLARPEPDLAACPGALAGHFLHTSHGPTVEALARHFEELWAQGTPFAEQRLRVEKGLDGRTAPLAEDAGPLPAPRRHAQGR